MDFFLATTTTNSVQIYAFVACFAHTTTHSSLNTYILLSFSNSGEEPLFTVYTVIFDVIKTTIFIIPK